MNARNAHRIRLGIHLAKGDLVAVRLGLTPFGILLLAEAYPVTARAYDRTMRAAIRGILDRITRHARDTA